MAQIATTEEGAIIRPLRILEPLIKEDFEQAEQAGMPYYEKAGAKLLEAKEGHFEGNTTGFFEWGEKKFGKSQSQIRLYVRLAATQIDKPRKTYRNLDDFQQRGLGIDRSGSSSGPRRDWTTPVDAVAERARNEARRLALEESLTRTQERKAEQQLALRLIDIGFKVLARELHPDKGGSREAMARLNRVRDRLKEFF